jgi:hypothetical protein
VYHLEGARCVASPAVKSGSVLMSCNENGGWESNPPSEARHEAAKCRPNTLCSFYNRIVPSVLVQLCAGAGFVRLGRFSLDRARLGARGSHGTGTDVLLVYADRLEPRPALCRGRSVIGGVRRV